ncbi:hypothetical protein NMY22_g6017 [Coprinellus aureogranulatus]|nr:hypothetical protein NMY22_g6017 [Coprinellus aureogranulatus]
MLLPVLPLLPGFHRSTIKRALRAQAAQQPDIYTLLPYLPCPFHLLPCLTSLCAPRPRPPPFFHNFGPLQPTPSFSRTAVTRRSYPFPSHPRPPRAVDSVSVWKPKEKRHPEEQPQLLGNPINRSHLAIHE